MSAFKERLALEETEFNYHQMGPRFPIQDKTDPQAEAEVSEETVD